MRKYDLVNTATGETVEGIPVWVGRKTPSIYGNRWLQMSQDPLIEIAKDQSLVGRPTQVLMYLLGKLDLENWIYLQQTEIADALDIRDKAHVSRYISLLCKKGILLKGPKIGKSYGYRLNPYFGWKGSNDKARALQLELIKGGKE